MKSLIITGSFGTIWQSLIVRNNHTPEVQAQISNGLQLARWFRRYQMTPISASLVLADSHYIKDDGSERIADGQRK